MAEAPGGAAQALQLLGAGGGPGGGAAATLVALCAGAVASPGVHPYVKLAFIAVAITLEFIRWWNASKAIPQCKLIQGVPEEGGVAYKQQVVRYSQEPYYVRYSPLTGTITGIACVPVSEDIQSPEAEVVDGGINCSSVTIRLTPVEEGKWACDIAICVKPGAAKPATEAAPDQQSAPVQQAAPDQHAAPVKQVDQQAAPAKQVDQQAAPAPVATTPTEPATWTAGTPAGIPRWLVPLLVVMFVVLIVIMIMMIVIVIRA